MIKLAPNAPVAHQRLALALAAVNNIEEARASLQRALELAPQFLPARLSMISLDVTQEKFEAALQKAEALRERFPSRPVADLAIGDIQLRAKKFDEAEAAFERAQEILPNSNTAIRLFQARLLAKRPKDAVAGIQDWLKENSKDNAARFALASHYFTTSEFDKALVEHEVLYASEPENQIVLNNLAWLYDRKNDDRAVELAERAHSKAVRSPTVKDTLGWILIRRGDRKRGRELITDAAKILTTNAEVQYHYAYALNADGEKEAAREILEKVINEDTLPFADLDDARALLKSLQ